MPKPTTALLLAASLTLALAACGQSPAPAPAALPEVTVTASATGDTLPGALTSGLVAVTLQNTDQRPHSAEFVRLRPDVTQDAVQSALAAGDFETLGTLVVESGSTPEVQAGGSGRVILDLLAGDYLVVDESANPDDPPVIAAHVSVTPRSGPAVAEPQADLTVNASDFAFDLPGNLHAGPQLWQFVNVGAQPHEVFVVKLHDGKTVDDVKAFLDEPQPDFSQAPADYVTGIPPIGAGLREFYPITLDAGRYVAVCGVMDPATGEPHDDLGMIMAFTVTN